MSKWAIGKACDCAYLETKDDARASHANNVPARRVHIVGSATERLDYIKHMAVEMDGVVCTSSDVEFL
jgi:hypothetical protein